MDVFADPDVRRGLQLYIDFILRRIDWFAAATAAQYARVPAFAPMLAKLTTDSLKKQHTENVERLQRAVSHDDWEPYLSNLRARGVAYAQMGIGWTAWTEVFQRSLIEHVDAVFDDLPDDKDRRAAMKGITAIFDTVVQTIGATFFAAQTEKLSQQHATIRALSAPILLAAERVLLVPLIGELDDDRIAALTKELLLEIRAERARVVVFAMKGVPDIDTAGAAALHRLCASSALMGCRVLMSGLREDVTQSLVTLGIDFPETESHGTLASALKSAIAHVGSDRDVRGSAVPS